MFHTCTVSQERVRISYKMLQYNVSHLYHESQYVLNWLCNSSHPHTQLFISPLSGTTQVSRNLKKHSPTHIHEEEEGFAQTTTSALSQQGLLDPIKPAYNQSRPDGRLKLTASTFNRLWISMPAVLITAPTVMQNLLHPLSTSSITVRHLLYFSLTQYFIKCIQSSVMVLLIPLSDVAVHWGKN